MCFDVAEPHSASLEATQPLRPEGKNRRKPEIKRESSGDQGTEAGRMLGSQLKERGWRPPLPSAPGAGGEGRKLVLLKFTSQRNNGNGFLAPRQF